MGRRGRKPLYAKREAFAMLIADGVPSATACRMVGVCRRTGTRWRNGRRLVSGGRVLNLPPVINVSPKPERRYSPRYLSDDERVRLADLRQERRTMREIAALMGRSLSTISRELARGVDAAGRYPPFWLFAIEAAPQAALWRWDGEHLSEVEPPAARFLTTSSFRSRRSR